MGLLSGYLVGMTPLVYADEDSTVRENLAETAAEVKACKKQFLSFLSEMMDMSGGGEFFKDLFKRNRCQQNDIFALDDAIEQLRKDLREKYYEECSSTEIPTMKQDIREGKMELYFVRNILPVNEDTWYNDDSAAFEDIMDLNRQVVESLLISEYVEHKRRNWVTEPQLIALVDGWMEQYENRFPQYLECTDSPWQEVADKWKELVDTLNLIKAAQEIGNEAKEMEEEYQREKAQREKEQGIDPGGEKGSGGFFSKPFFKKHFDMEIKGLPKKKDKKDFTDGDSEAEEEIDSSISSSELFDLLGGEEDIFNTRIQQAEMMAKYNQRYGTDGTGGITNVLFNQLGELRAIIVATTNTTEYLAGLDDVAKAIQKKQGSGTP